MEITTIECKHYNKCWNNGTIVYLGVDDELTLQWWANFLKKSNQPYSMFEEPDWDVVSHKTALATIAYKNEIFSDLHILKMEKKHFKILQKLKSIIN